MVLDKMAAIGNPDAIQKPDKVDHSKSEPVRISDPHCKQMCDIVIYSGDLNSQLVRYSNGPKQFVHLFFLFYTLLALD